MLGIIILNYNTPYDTIKCIESIVRYTNSKYKIYIVDNFSKDKSIEILNDNLKKYIQNNICEIISSNQNNGYSSGNNIGIKKAIIEKCDKILIVNSDVILLNNAIDLMIEILNSKNDIYIIGPYIINSKEEESYFNRRPLTFFSFVINKKPFVYFYLLSRKNIKISEIRNINKINNTDLILFNGMVSGCCFMFKVELINKIGLLDDNLFLFHEEDIIAHKLRQLNIKAAFYKKAKVMHFGSKSTSMKGLAFERYNRYLSSLYVMKYYAKENIIYIIIASIINIFPMIINSIFLKEYRKLIKKYIYNNINIIISTKEIKIY